MMGLLWLRANGEEPRKREEERKRRGWKGKKSLTGAEKGRRFAKLIRAP